MRIRGKRKRQFHEELKARIKNRQLKGRQEDDLADDLSNPQVMVL
ncbi:hypothetical protein TNCV_3345801, partial [Trichonephila clavipes]